MYANKEKKNQRIKKQKMEEMKCKRIIWVRYLYNLMICRFENPWASKLVTTGTSNLLIVQNFLNSPENQKISLQFKEVINF